MNDKNTLKMLNLPALKTREEMLSLLNYGEYGIIPETDCEISFADEKIIEERLVSGAVSLSCIQMTVKNKNGQHTFPVYRLLHHDGQKHPFFVFLNFNDRIPDFYYPAEELAENGFDVLSVCYNDITKDNDDFSDGLAAILLPNGQEHGDSAGKIAIWAFAASKILDYAETLECLDMQNAAVIGHSRLGKTALLAGAADERFRFVFSNDSGCSGAALSKKADYFTRPVLAVTDRETLPSIVERFPYWFCKNYRQYVQKGYADSFDQHYLLASVCPRYVCVGSASQDLWADPESEYLCCLAAGEMYQSQNLSGLTELAGDSLFDKISLDGHIGYEIRDGLHFLSRHDWHYYMDFINKHLTK